MPSYKRSKSQKKNGGSRNRSRSTRSAKRGGKRATKSSRGGQRAKKNVMQRGGGDVVTYDELQARLNEDNAMGEFLYVMHFSSFDEFKSGGQGSSTVDIKKIKDEFFDKENPIYANARLALLTLLSK